VKRVWVLPVAVAVAVAAVCVAAAVLATRPSPPVDGSVALDAPPDAPPDETAPVPVPNSTNGLKSDLQDTFRAHGLQAALERYEDLATADPYVREQCHGALRTIGREAASTDTFPLYRDSSCQNGFTHGVLYQAALNYDDPVAYVADADRYCAGFHPDETAVGDCIHGIGHGVAIAAAGDFTIGAAACAQIGPGTSMALCADGLVMEFGEGTLREAPWNSGIVAPGHMLDAMPILIVVPADQVPGLCASMPAPMRPPCYYRVWMFHAALLADGPTGDEDHAMAASVCASLTIAAERTSCLEGFGEFSVAMPRLFAPNAPLWPPGSATDAEAYAVLIVERCRLHPEFTACMAGAVPSSSGSLYVAEWEFIPPYCDVVRADELAGCAAAVTRARGEPSPTTET
jgi:hypothetical protein